MISIYKNNLIIKNKDIIKKYTFPKFKKYTINKNNKMLFKYFLQNLQKCIIKLNKIHRSF